MTQTTILILGGTSDLAQRLLIPGMADYLSAVSDADLRIVGAGPSVEGSFQEFVRDAIVDSDADGIREEVVKKLGDEARWITADATDKEDLTRAISEATKGQDGRLVIYYALAPEVTVQSIDVLHGVDLPEGTILALEKPFGTDAGSATELDEALRAVVPEENIFRVDHFLAESATLNLEGILESNRIFQAGWSREAVESVDVVFDESLGLEGRAEFYDSTGALQDMLQSHLIMTAATILAAGPGKESMTEILDAMSADPAKAHRARYTAGSIDGRELPDYAKEEGVDPQRETETLAQVTLSVDTDQWRDVPVTLRSGKAIGDPLQAITVSYRATEECPDAPTTRLVLPFEDALALDISVHDFSDPQELRQTRLAGDLSPSHLTPYARVVRALNSNDHSVAVPAGASARAWEVLQPVIDAFESGEIPLDEYEAGSHGPESFYE